MKNELLGADDFVRLLREAVTSGNKQKILEAYDTIREADIDFGACPPFIGEEYDELVEAGNKILGI